MGKREYGSSDVTETKKMKYMFNKFKYLIIVWCIIYGEINGEVLIVFSKYRIMHRTQKQKSFRDNFIMLVLRR